MDEPIEIPVRISDDNIIEKRKSKVTLETIDDHCLLNIFEYLNIFDAEKLASIWPRMRHFVNDFIYPKLARRIEIHMISSDDENQLDSWDVNGIKELREQFREFGKFIEHISFVRSDTMPDNEEFWTPLRKVQKLLNLCPNLHTLSFVGVDFRDPDEEEIRFLEYVAFSLIELKFIDCSGINDELSQSLESHPQLKRITLTGTHETTDEFLQHNRNLSSLAISHHSCTVQGLKTILNRSGHSIQQLSLIKYSKSSQFESIVTLIADKLPKLEYLAIEDDFSIKLMNSLTALPHLKSLKINCSRLCVISLLRILSDRGTIEDLEIKNFIIDDKNANGRPLIFSQLRTLRCPKSSKKSLRAFLKVMTESQMPAIHSLLMQGHKSIEQDILTLFESKKSLKTLNIKYMHDTNSFALLCGIIEILKDDRNRPFLNLHISSPKIGKEEVSQKICWT